MKKASIVLIIIIAILGGLIGGYIICTRVLDQTDQMVGDDVDEHLCIPSAGYGWCEARQECIRPWEKKCDDASMRAAVDSLMDSLTSSADLWFIGLSETTFSWTTDGGAEDVNGLMFRVDDAPTDLRTKIVEVFDEQGFVRDDNNVQDGTIISSTAYQDGIMVCLLTTGVSGYVDDSFVSFVEVSCGQLSEYFNEDDFRSMLE